jgi:hypothetical protein
MRLTFFVSAQQGPVQSGAHFIFLMRLTFFMSAQQGPVQSDPHLILTHFGPSPARQGLLQPGAQDGETQCFLASILPHLIPYRRQAVFSQEQAVWSRHISRHLGPQTAAAQPAVHDSPQEGEHREDWAQLFAHSAVLEAQDVAHLDALSHLAPLALQAVVQDLPHLEGSAAQEVAQANPVTLQHLAAFEHGFLAEYLLQSSPLDLHSFLQPAAFASELWQLPAWDTFCLQSPSAGHCWARPGAAATNKKASATAATNGRTNR